MAEVNKKDAHLILCAHKETGKHKLCPKHWFEDKGLAARLDWTPIEIRKFEEPLNPTVAEALKKEKEAEVAKKLEAEKKEIEIKDKK